MKITALPFALALSALLFTGLVPFSIAVSEAPQVQWTKTYAGASGNCVIQTSDQGYLIVSSPQISSSDTVLELIKTDSFGNQVWLRTYLGFPGSVLALQTKDGGYAIAGTTSDNLRKFFLAKLDSAGAVVWNNTYSDSRFDTLTNLIQTGDGSFALFGNSADYVLDNFRAAFVKVDNSGHLIWNQTYGGSRDFSACGLSQTKDGGYILVVSTSYFGFSVWLVKTDALGNTQWFRPFQGNRIGSEPTQIYGSAGFATSDGGYLLLSSLSWYQSSGYMSAGFAIKTDANGDQQWNKTYQNTYSTAIQTSDGGYVLGQASGSSVILSKFDGLGNMLWNGSYAGSVGNSADFLTGTADGGLAITGVSSNHVMLTKIAPGASAPPIQLPPSVSHSTANATVIQQTFFPGVGCTSMIQTLDGGYAAVGQVSNVENEAYSVLLKTDALGNLVWSRPIHFGSTDTYMSVVVQTRDGGLAVAGQKKVNYPLGPSQFCIVKFSSTGQLQWNQTYPTTSQQSYGDYLKDFIQTSDGGYMLAGTTEYVGGYISALFMVRTDSTGNFVWNKTIANVNGTQPGTEVSSLVQTGDGGFSVIGTDYSYASSTPSAFKIIHLDAIGNVLWAKTYGNQNGSGYTREGVLTRDGGYLIVGGYRPSSSSPNYPLLVKTDSQGNMVWYKLFDDGQFYDAFAVAQTSDGGYVFLSYTDRYPCLIKVNALGDIEGLITVDTIFTDVYTPSISAVTMSADNAYVIAGHYIGLNNTVYDDIWLAKLSMSPTPVIPEFSPMLMLVSLCLISIAMCLATIKWSRNLD